MGIAEEIAIEEADILAALKKDGGWLNINALWNRTSIPHKAVCSSAVGRLLRQQRLQKRMTRIGEEYALPGATGGRDLVAPSKVTQIPADGYVAAESKPLTGPPVKMPNVTVPAQPKSRVVTLQIRERIVAFMRAQGAPVTVPQLTERFGMTDKQIAYFLRLERQLGTVQLSGTGRASSWSIAGPQPNATAAGATPAVQATVTHNGASPGDAPPPAYSAVVTEPIGSRKEPLTTVPRRELVDFAGDVDCALFSDGRLLIEDAAVEIRLAPGATRKLLAFLDGTLIRGAA